MVLSQLHPLKPLNSLFPHDVLHSLDHESHSSTNSSHIHVPRKLFSGLWDHTSDFPNLQWNELSSRRNLFPLHLTTPASCPGIVPATLLVPASYPLNPRTVTGPAGFTLRAFHCSALFRWPVCLLSHLYDFQRTLAHRQSLPMQLSHVFPPTSSTPYNQPKPLPREESFLFSFFLLELLFSVLGIESRASSLPSKYSLTGLHFQSHVIWFDF